MEKKLFVMILGLFIGFALPVQAQKMIRVTGTVYNIARKKRVIFTEAEVKVYSCKTVAEAQDLKKKLDANDVDLALVIDPGSVTTIDQNAYYEIMVPDNGALIFKADMSPCVLEKVRNRMKIDVGIDAGIQMDEVVVTGLRTEIKPEPKNTRLVGNRFFPYNTFIIPDNTGNDYSRLIIQPYVLNCETEDTVAFCRPLVYDGEEYHLTQYRYMGHELAHDALSQWVQSEPLSRHSMHVEWEDTVLVPNANASYTCFADFVIENYQAVTYHKTFMLNTCQNKRHMRFLQYSFLPQSLDFMKYKERAQVEKHNSSDQVSLTFKVNTDELDDTPENETNLNKVKSRLNEIVNSPGATLKEFYITGISSPDGPYARNMYLSKQRVSHIHKLLVSSLPRSIINKVYQVPDAKVASWQAVADLLRADGHEEEAKDVEYAISKYPNSVDDQTAKIRSHSYYRTLIPNYLKQLRQVEYRCKYEIYREPTDEEIMNEYRQHGLQMEYTRYEYWKLFQLLKEPKAIEDLARKAYEESIQQNERRPWLLPANVLALQYLKRDTFDVHVLEPFIDKSIYTINYERRNIITNRMETINPEEVVVNQLCMYIKANDFEQASVLAKILPDRDDFKLIKAYAWALGGYFQGGDTPEERQRAQQTFDMISSTSPRNKVVMWLALDTRKGDAEAEKAVAELPQTEAMTWYFRAVIAARRGDAGFTDAMMALVECFKADKTFVPIAQSDGEFTAELLETALDMYSMY